MDRFPGGGKSYYKNKIKLGLESEDFKIFLNLALIMIKHILWFKIHQI